VDPASGAFKITGLPLGTYTLQEYKAPAGYKLSSATHTFTLTAQQTSYSFTAAFTDEQQDQPSLPLTGGQSIDSYLIGGSVIMILSLGIGYAMHRRREGSVR
jgi:LPXTG-motif cell wall-anchored protein